MAGSLRGLVASVTARGRAVVNSSRSRAVYVKLCQNDKKSAAKPSKDLRKKQDMVPVLCSVLGAAKFLTTNSVEKTSLY